MCLNLFKLGLKKNQNKKKVPHKQLWLRPYVLFTIQRNSVSLQWDSSLLKTIIHSMNNWYLKFWQRAFACALSETAELCKT